MTTIFGSLDTAAKRWLAVLAVAFVVSVGVMVHSFLSTLSPPEEPTVAAQVKAPMATQEVRTRAEPAWDNPQQAPTVEQSKVADRVSPFDTKPALIQRKADPAARQEMVHRQADYLRNLIANGRLPSGLGNLTKEQVDEMEKKGIMIN